MKAPELKDRLEESEKLIQEMTVTWEQKLRKTESIAQVTHAYNCCIVISCRKVEKGFLQIHIYYKPKEKIV